MRAWSCSRHLLHGGRSFAASRGREEKHGLGRREDEDAALSLGDKEDWRAYIEEALGDGAGSEGSSGQDPGGVLRYKQEEDEQRKGPRRLASDLQRGAKNDQDSRLPRKELATKGNAVQGGRRGTGPYIREPIPPSKEDIHQRYGASGTLPLPPFLRPKYGVKRETEYGGLYYGMNEKTHKQNLRDAPFATRMIENPYAHALADSMREECLTKARLPRSCLMHFNIVDGPLDEPVDPAEQILGKKKPALEPMGLIAELVNKKRFMTRPTDRDRHALEVSGEDASDPVPSGTTSYVMNSYDVLKWISEAPTKRVTRFALSIRMRDSLPLYGAGQRSKGAPPVIWRADMADFVLEKMRAVVVKQLRYWIANKGKPDKVGPVMQLPGNELRGLDSIDDAMAVIRLTPFDADAKLAKDDYEQQRSLYKELKFTTEETKSAEEQSTAEDDGGQPSLPADGEKTEAEEGSEKGDTSQPKRVKVTRRPRTGPWSEDSANSFHTHVRLLPPPPKPFVTYYPTLQYRNRRVPAYSLPFLLGEERARELVASSAFEDSVYIAVTSSIATIQLQRWLLHLHSYIGKTKAETPKV